MVCRSRQAMSGWSELQSVAAFESVLHIRIYRSKAALQSQAVQARQDQAAPSLKLPRRGGRVMMKMRSACTYMSFPSLYQQVVACCSKL